MSDSKQHSPSHSSTDSSIGAFFDVDNTLIPGQSIEIRFVRYLWKNGFLSKRVIIDSALYLLFNILEFSLSPLRERKIYLLDKRPEGIEPLAKWFVRSEICQSPIVRSGGRTTCGSESSPAICAARSIASSSVMRPSIRPRSRACRPE